VWVLTVFVEESYPSCWVFTAKQSIHMWMNLSLSSPLIKSWIRLWKELQYFFSLFNRHLAELICQIFCY